MQILSEALGEDLNKSNFRATIERLGFANFKSPIIGNRVKVDNINLCPNPSSMDEYTPTDSNSEPMSTQNYALSILERTIKLETVSKLAKLGLTPEQIAQALELPIDAVKQALN